MLKVVVGHSNDPDSQSAIEDVLYQCKTGLAGAIPSAGILLADVEFDHSLILNIINQFFPDIALIGGTTDGEFSSILSFQQDSLVLLLFCSNSITIRAGIGRQLSKNAEAAAQRAVRHATTDLSQPVKLCLAIPESLTASSVSLLAGLKTALGKSVPILGGLTADQWNFENTYQFFQTEVLQDSVPILVFAGNFLLSYGFASGWHPIGKPGRVSKVKQNIIYEIDEQPALNFYHRYLGGLSPTTEYPLAIFNEHNQVMSVRAPSGCNPETGIVTFYGDVPDQAIVQIAETTREDILAASKTSIIQALERYPGTNPATALFFSCAARRQILGIRTGEEYQCVKSILPPDIPSCGFYTYGEFSPLIPTGESHFHNETFVSLLLGIQ